MKKPISTGTWPKYRPKISIEFDIDCLMVARGFLALQARELTALQQQKAGSLSQRGMSAMAISIRKMQEVGRMALGETTDRQQLDLDFGPQEVIIKWPD
jgi:hypothetical protein